MGGWCVSRPIVDVLAKSSQHDRARGDEGSPRRCGTRQDEDAFFPRIVANSVSSAASTSSQAAALSRRGAWTSAGTSCSGASGSLYACPSGIASPHDDGGGLRAVAGRQCLRTPLRLRILHRPGMVKARLTPGAFRLCEVLLAKRHKPLVHRNFRRYFR